jgi:arylmalonate decarboxylase
MTTHVPKIGLIVPLASGQVLPEAGMLYPTRATFFAKGLGLQEMSHRGYDSVIDAIAPAARALAAEGADAIVLMGTSLSFYKGAGFNRSLVQRLAEAGGLPCSTMSTAVVRALRAVGIRKVAVVTAYTDEVNQDLVRFLSEEDFEVTHIDGLSITSLTNVHEVPATRLLDMCRAAMKTGPKPDGILISCGGLLTLDVITAAEHELSVPVVSSAPAAFYEAARLAGLDPRVEGKGRLFELA